MDFFNNMNGDNQQQNPQGESRSCSNYSANLVLTDPNMQQGNQQMQQGQQMQQPDQASNEGGGFMGMAGHSWLFCVLANRGFHRSTMLPAVSAHTQRFLNFTDRSIGGQQGEKNEEMLDKGLDYIQEKYMGAGDQGNE